ncbi:uncharacterized protein MELLADRAFT_91694 [Melampsora larici-populina 98AG31]|uniref:Uncharacterized protein n=1 Tax=Melampsora larici-populina (strain 98AG31 / pathotype 3-4-7) TaxID=747676 RepID=F4RZZ1_MELLP|nr:uncharacterized protein MELLADRAFT_91694 [Melampsora larici-populina 98AG31]EGG02085.1 hypothetical protein MELLADRAFT_91694 [Melampsora larici-populina 98AG31]
MATIQSPANRSPNCGAKTGGGITVKRKNHPFIVSSLFDVFENVGPEVSGMYGFRHSHTTIVTRDGSGDSVEWVIKCVAYGGTDGILDVDGVYCLKGRLLALNQKETQKFYYEPDFQLLANTSKNLPFNLANGVSVTGLGIIETRVVDPVEPGKENIFLIVKHSDYNPDIQAQSTFKVEYRAMWSKLMEKLQPLMTEGREVMLTGHIVGRNENEDMWIVQMTGVSVTSGSENVSAPVTVDGASSCATPRGRKRAKMIFTESNGTGPLASTSGSAQVADEDPNVKGKGKSSGKPVPIRQVPKRPKGTASDADI